jgi:hypothetical protein
MAGSAGPPGTTVPVAGKRVTNFWREYNTQCANCAKLGKHTSGFLFTGMTPDGDFKTFCNVDCCAAWEKNGDNTNSRREAIKAQRAKVKRTCT